MSKLKKFFKIKKKVSALHLPSHLKLKEKKTSKSFEFSFFSYTSFSIKKQTFFAKRLSFLIKAGVPMLESMHVIKAQSKGKSDIKVFDKIIGDIANGQSLAGSLGRFKNVFGDFTINVIKAGESSGTLIQNLTYLADELKKKEILKKKIMSAMLYPIIVTVATFGIVGFLTVYIFPKITPIFSSLKVDLPISTKIIIFITNLLREDGVWILLGLIIIITTIVLLIKRVPPVKFFYHGLLLRLPIFGPIVKNYNLTNTMRTLGLLLRSGLSLNESLAITGDTTENVRYKRAFEEISSSIFKGKTVSELVGKYPYLFPAMQIHMIAIGEKSGNLSNTLIYLSEYSEHEFDEQTKNLSSTVEPVLMIIMGLMVGFVAISVITPIYEITSNLQR